MAWSWSHTSEAYENAMKNISELETSELCIIFAEWRASQGKRGIIDPVSPAFSERKYKRALAYAEKLASNPLGNEALAEVIWEQASEFATCDNGGFNAWVCPYGCHTVPFSRDDDTDEQGE
jgi:hypothetical protein